MIDAAGVCVFNLGKSLMENPHYRKEFRIAILLGVSTAPAPAVTQTRREATPAELLYTLRDFKTELLLTGEPDEGSWVNLCHDNRGRLIII